jgi:hypothetical protein
MYLSKPKGARMITLLAKILGAVRLVRMRSFTIAAFLLVVATSACQLLASGDMAISPRLSGIQVTFTENRGQWDSQVLYRAQSDHATMWFTKDGLYFQFLRPKSKGPADPHDFERKSPPDLEQFVIKAAFVGANPNPAISSEGLSEYKCNYFIGTDQSKWQADVPNYESVTYRGLYDGVDLKFRAEAGKVACEFNIAPGADPNQIKIAFQGPQSIAIDQSGNLVIHSLWGDALEPAPLSYQASATSRTRLATQWELIDGSTARLTIADSVSRSERIQLSPSLTFSTYLGGADSDFPADMTVNLSGEVFIAGSTWSTTFPVVNGYDLAHGGAGSTDVFVTKFNTAGNGLLFSTFLGGSSFDHGYAMVVGASGNYGIFLTGSTSSADFPNQGAVDGTYGGNTDAFVAVLSLAGNGLTFSTYLGGGDNEFARDLAVRCVAPCTIDKYTVWVCGGTFSTDFPTSNAYSSTLNGTEDAFLTQYTIGTVGNSMGRSTYFGGSDGDDAYAIVMAGGTSGKPIIVGETESSDLPTVGAYDATLGGYGDAFVSGFDYAGNGQIFPVFSTYLGGSSSNLAEFPSSILLRTSGNIVVAGITNSTNFPTFAGFDNSHNGSEDIYITEFNSTASALVHSTYFGGSGSDQLGTLTQDRLGNIILTGSTSSTNLPLSNPYDALLGGTQDAFVAKFNSSAQTLQFSSYLGGSATDYGTAIVADTLGCLYVTGSTSSTNFPLVSPYDPTNNNADCFLTKICLPAYVCGDANGSGAVSISDAVYLINYIFAGGPAPNPVVAADANCSGTVSISDAVYLINYIFAGGAAPCAACP